MKLALGLILIVYLGMPSQLAAQAVGQILGTVSDPTGAVIPGAKVTAVQNGTGFTRFTNTSGAGFYSLPSLPVGTFTVTAEASGFSSGALNVTLDG